MKASMGVLSRNKADSIETGATAGVISSHKGLLSKNTDWGNFKAGFIHPYLKLNFKYQRFHI